MGIFNVKRTIGLALLGALSSILGACAPLGPQALKATRPLFNEAVQQTESQQLLLNIVRQRYSDPVMFLDVTSISSGASRQFNANILNKILPSGKDEFQNGAGVTIGESPVIFYAPNTGEKFVRQMLLPLDLRAVTIVLQGGWSVERVMLLTTESINQLRNVPSAGASDFAQLSRALRDLQRDGQLSIGVEAAGKDATGKDNVQSVVLTVLAAADTSEPYRKICSLLSVACDGRPIKLRLALGGANDGVSAAMATRSLLSAMFVLAQGVEVPAEDLENNVVDTSAGALNRARGVLFRVRSSAAEPPRAAVKVFYRNTWFYIADDDTDTKTTFGLLSLLVTLQAGDVSKVTPLIALPAN